MRTNLSTLIKYLAIAGNVLFILWVTYNGIDEGFQRHDIPEDFVCRLDAFAGAQYGFDFEKRKVSCAPFALWAPPPFSTFSKMGEAGWGLFL